MITYNLNGKVGIHRNNKYHPPTKKTIEIQKQKKKEENELLQINISKGSSHIPLERYNKITIKGSSLTKKSSQNFSNLFYYLYYRSTNKYPFKLFTVTLPTAKNKINNLEVFESDNYYTKKLSMMLENFKKVSAKIENPKKKDIYNHKIINFNQYAWVSERQKKNNRNALHFHIVIDTYYINLNYFSQYWSKLVSDYHNPSTNCIDVEYILDIKTLKKYLFKYLFKDKNSSKIYSKTSSMSRGFSDICKKLKKKSNIKLHTDETELYYTMHRINDKNTVVSYTITEESSKKIILGK